LATAFEEKFGVVLTEGFGATELSPVGAFNVPENRSGVGTQIGLKKGTVGRPMPGSMAKVVNPETLEELSVNQDGLLMFKGPNVMQGYLNMPEKTAEVIIDDWYNTGDIAKIDEDGFIEITGRQSRFSKIGGEMVPHVKIEQLLSEIVEDHEADEPEIQIAVTSVPDEKKGERLIVLHKKLAQPVEQVLEELAKNDIPNLWLPSKDSFFEVNEIPLLGSGKLDLKGIKDKALEVFVGVQVEKPS